MAIKKRTGEDRIVTVPNILTIVRLALIPIFVVLYFQQRYPLATVILVISGITDVVDGIIARKFSLVTRIGKAIDPIADKLTQAVVLVCLAFRFRLMLVPLILLVVKEIFNSILHIIVIRKTGEVFGAVWYGKVATVFLYITIGLHALWYNIPEVLSAIVIFVCTGLILLSMVLYTIRYFTLIKEADGKKSGKQ